MCFRFQEKQILLNHSLQYRSIHCCVLHFYLGPVFNKFKVSTVESVNHNTKLFALEPPPGMKVHVPVGQFVRLKASIKGKLLGYIVFVKIIFVCRIYATLC